MDRTLKSPFICMRCRLQRLKDAKFFGGWVQDLSEDQLHVKLSTKSDLAQGDNFSVEIHGAGKSAMFHAWLAHQQDGQLVFLINDKVKYMPSRETARMTVDNVLGRCFLSEHELGLSVIDVSAKGCGVLSAEKLTRGEKLDLEFETPYGVVRCVGEVRYSKTSPEHGGMYRTGIRFEPMARLELARWMKFFDFEVEAA